MNYISEAIDSLKEYTLLVSSEKSICDKLKELNIERDLVKAQVIKDAPGGGNSIPDEALVNNIANRIEFRNRLKITKIKIYQIERALEKLSTEERLVLEIIFVNGGKRSIEHAMDRLNCEQNKVYTLRREALQKYGRAMYGIGIA